MKKPQQHKHQKFDPDALDFYVWDHLNIEARLDALEFKVQEKDTGQYKVCDRSVPLVRGYKHERSRRPANFCHIITTVFAHSSEIHVNFAFGWFRRRAGHMWEKQTFIIVPNGEYAARWSIHEHSALKEFENEMRDIIKVLQNHDFDNIQQLFSLMAYWTGARHTYWMPDWKALCLPSNATRTERALAVIKDYSEPDHIAPASRPRIVHHRMGRPLVRHSNVSYRGR